MDIIKDFRKRDDIAAMLSFRSTMGMPRGLWLGSGNGTKEILTGGKDYVGGFSMIGCANRAHEYLHELANFTYPQTEWFWICPEEGKYNEDWFWTVPVWWWKFVPSADAEKIGELLKAKHPTNYEELAKKWVGITTHNNEGCFNTSNYVYGLQRGNADKFGNYAGTASLQGIHMLSIMGCRRIDAFGVELQLEEGEPVHFYDTEWVNDFTQSVEQISEHWKQSAKYIREVIMPAYRDKGIDVVIHGKSKILED
jgi:hypothetical protein